MYPIIPGRFIQVFYGSHEILAIKNMLNSEIFCQLVKRKKFSTCIGDGERAMEYIIFSKSHMDLIFDTFFKNFLKVETSKKIRGKIVKLFKCDFIKVSALFQDEIGTKVETAVALQCRNGMPQRRRKVQKMEEGTWVGSNNVVGIICPPGWNRVK